MLDHFIGNRCTVRRLQSGVIGSQLDSFATHLAQDGYAVTTVRAQLTLLGHFSQWLTRRGCGIHGLNDELVGTFVSDRKRCGRLHRGHAATLHRFLTHLRARGVIASPAPVVGPRWATGAALSAPEGGRGLALATVTKYCGVFRG